MLTPNEIHEKSRKIFPINPFVGHLITAYAETYVEIIWDPMRGLMGPYGPLTQEHSCVVDLGARAAP